MNLGALMRSAYFLGVDKVVACKHKWYVSRLRNTWKFPNHFENVYVVSLISKFFVIVSFTSTS